MWACIANHAFKLATTEQPNIAGARELFHRASQMERHVGGDATQALIFCSGAAVLDWQEEDADADVEACLKLQFIEPRDRTLPFGRLWRCTFSYLSGCRVRRFRGPCTFASFAGVLLTRWSWRHGVPASKHSSVTCNCACYACRFAFLFVSVH